jgi:hypothetical protein
MDILERLRDPKPDWVMSSNAKKLLADADAEIVKLREALRYMVENPEDVESFWQIARVALGK